jgi:hypothetical protein
VENMKKQKQEKEISAAAKKAQLIIEVADLMESKGYDHMSAWFICRDATAIVKAREVMRASALKSA